jgi:hypothetical protein
MPDVYLGGGHAPLVLTVALQRCDPSPRWEQIVEPAPGRPMHHLELCAADAIDDSVRESLAEAWKAAAWRREVSGGALQLRRWNALGA